MDQPKMKKPPENLNQSKIVSLIVPSTSNLRTESHKNSNNNSNNNNNNNNNNKTNQKQPPSSGTEKSHTKNETNPTATSSAPSSSAAAAAVSSNGKKRHRNKKSEKQPKQNGLIKKIKQTAEQPRRDIELEKRINNALQYCPPGKEIPTLCFNLQSDPRLLSHAFTQIRNDLLQLLRSRFPYDPIEIYCFGSTLNKTAFKDSDFDLYIRMPGDGLPAKRLVYLVSGLMRSNQIFTNSIPIGNAKVPIIKAIHQRTGYPCDISFSNGLNGTNGMGVYNTNALRYLLEIDYRLLPLAIILKYWMRTHELSGSFKITNYCLFMLIIYYVQTLDNPILPPIVEFQKNCDEYNVGSWNVAINVQYSIQNVCTKKISELLLGFFEFYATFDFKRYLISPAFGRTYERNVFAYIETIPKEYERYVRHLKEDDPQTLNLKNSLCVQDPFNYAHNVGASCGARLFEQFQRELANAADICKTMLSKDGESATLLLRLFNESAPAEKNRKENSTEKRCYTCNMKPTEFEIECIRRVLTKRAAVPANGSSMAPTNKNESTNQPIEQYEIMREWSQRTIEFIHSIIERFFLFNINILNSSNIDNAPNDPNETNRKINKSASAILSEWHQQLEINGEYNVYHNVYQNRKQLNVSMPAYIDEIEMMAKKLRDRKESPIQLHCLLDISVTMESKSQCEIEFNFRSCTIRDRCTKTFYNLFSQRIRSDLRAFYTRYMIRDMNDENVNKNVVNSNNKQIKSLATSSPSSSEVEEKVKQQAAPSSSKVVKEKCSPQQQQQQQ